MSFPAPRLAAAVALLLAACVIVVAPARAADELFLPIAPPSMTKPPPGYSISGQQALQRAITPPAVGRERAKGSALIARVFMFRAHDWQVRFYRGNDEIVRVELDGRSGRIDATWTGPEISWALARGSHGPAAERLHTVLIVLGLLFFIPFLDLRRPLRWLHLDLLVLLSFGLSQAFADRADIYLSVPLVYPPLLYLVVRMAWLALRGGQGEAGRLTWVSPRVLFGGLVALLVARYTFDLVYSSINDVGYASMFGADSVLNGLPIYDSSPASGNLDTYGPVAYLTYVPFDLIAPLKGLAHAHAGGARLAAITWDLATVTGLLFLGRQLRPGKQGRELGLALAWGFAAYPWTLFVLDNNTNDGLVSMFLVFALLVWRRPAARGAMLGLAAAAKFAPLALAGAFARVGDERGRRPLLLYGAALAAAVAIPILLYLPDGGLREFWDSTLGFQLTRSSPFSIWGLHPTWKPFEPIVSALAAAMAIAAFFVPRERSMPRVAAAGTAIIIATQLPARHWYYFYLVWFLPYALVALFSRSYATSVRNSGSSPTSAVASNTS